MRKLLNGALESKIFLIFLSFFCCQSLFARGDLAIVYVHLGNTLPSHMIESMRQMRLYNAGEAIFLCGNKAALHASQESLRSLDVQPVFVESLMQSEPHRIFLRDTAFREAFWIRTSERLLIVHELMKQKELQNVFHIESDVMVYGSFRELLPIFLKKYPSIAIPFANDKAAICSIVFFRNEQAACSLADCFARHAKERENDMRMPGILKEEKGLAVIDHLPILPTSYVKSTPQSLFINRVKEGVKNKSDFCKNFDDFACLFDAVTFGVLLSRKNKSICEGTIFDPRVFDITWKKDERNLCVPYVSHRGSVSKLFNLHIHAKNMAQFRSDNPVAPPSWVGGSFR